MSRHTYERYRDEYARLWESLEITPARRGVVQSSARRILENRSRYMEVERATGVPWWFVGVVHKMESSLDFTKHLHNGDSLKARTRLVPAGRPRTGSPPFTWLESATDALMMKGLHKLKDWSITRVCYELERYNGFGYRQFGINSPYLWSMTCHYQRGKYVEDGRFNRSAISSQSGTIALLKVLTELDHTVKFKAPIVAHGAPDENETLPPATAPTLGQSRTLYGAVTALVGGVVAWTSKTLGLVGDVAQEAQEVMSPVDSLLSVIGVHWPELGLFAVIIGCGLVIYARSDAAAKGKVG
jgi:lysozyme family protein